MANRHKGEVTLKAGDRSLTLRLGCNEMVEVQADLGIEDDARLVSVIARVRQFRGLRAIVFHALKGGGWKDVTLEQAGDIITDAGTDAVLAAILQCLSWAMPDTKGGASGKAVAPSAGAKPS